MSTNFSTALYRKIRRDQAFIVSEISQELSGGGTFNVHLKNPSDSGIEIWVLPISTTADGAYIARVKDGFSSAPSGGTAVEIQALLLDSDNIDNDGVASANRNVTFTATSEHAVGVAGGGEGSSSLGGEARGAALAIQPGREIVVEVENTTTASHNYGIQIRYLERPT